MKQILRLRVAGHTRQIDQMAHRKPADPGRIAKFLSDYMGRTVDASAREARSDLGAGVVAAYTDASGIIAALCVCDVDAAASLAAALSLDGRAKALEAANTQRITGSLRENFYDICTILGRLFNGTEENGHSDRLSLHSLTDIRSLPQDVASLLASPGARVDATVSVQGFSGGYFALLTR